MHRIWGLARLRHNLYALIIGIVGILMIVIVPPFQSPDEQTHLYRAYQLSEGGVIAKHLSFGAGDILPASLSQAFDSYYFLLFNPDNKTNSGLLKQSLSAPIDAKKEIETRFENTAVYPPAAYVPQIVGIWIGKLFSAGPVALLFLARLANLIAWVLILRLVIKRTPKLGLPILAFAMLPIVAFQASSASADVMTTAISLAFVGEVFRHATSKSKLTKRNVYVLIGLSLILALCKFPYVLIVALILILRSEKFTSSSQAWKVKSLILIPSAIVAMLWLVIGQRTFVNLRAGTDSGTQLVGIITAPVEYLQVLFRTYFTTTSDLLYIQMIGQLGWLDTKLPFWGLMCALVALLLAVLVSTKSTELLGLRRSQYYFIAGLLAALVLAISTALYLTWNAPGADVIDGLQGRYYLPLFGLVLILGFGFIKLSAANFENVQLAVYSLCTLSVLSMLVTLVYRYYSIG